MAARRKPKATEEKKPHRKARIPGLSARPVWQGQLRLSLVSCPVALYNATSRTNDISFHLINPETNNRIRMVATDPDTGPVSRSDLVRGYEIEKNRYVIMTEEDLDSVRLETTHTLDIERFVDADSIDRIFWSNPYLLMPGDDSAVEAYAVIREAMRGVGRIALGRVAMHTRERLIAVEPRGKGLLAYSLRMRDEVVDVDKAFDSIEAVRPGRSMIEIAEKIIEQAEGPFEPDEFRDRYEDALRDLIERKQKGEDTTVALPAPETSNVIDLMDALKKSLAHKGAAPRSKPAKKPAAAKGTSKAKKRTRKSA
jgi:DNA end-binding protein Ku